MDCITRLKTLAPPLLAEWIGVHDGLITYAFENMYDGQQPAGTVASEALFHALKDAVAPLPVLKEALVMYMRHTLHATNVTRSPMSRTNTQGLVQLLEKGVFTHRSQPRHIAGSLRQRGFVSGGFVTRAGTRFNDVVRMMDATGSCYALCDGSGVAHISIFGDDPTLSDTFHIGDFDAVVGSSIFLTSLGGWGTCPMRLALDADVYALGSRHPDLRSFTFTAWDPTWPASDAPEMHVPIETRLQALDKIILV